MKVPGLGWFLPALTLIPGAETMQVPQIARQVGGHSELAGYPPLSQSRQAIPHQVGTLVGQTRV